MASDPISENLDVICARFDALLEERMENLVELKEISRAIDKILLIGARLSVAELCIEVDDVA